MFAVHIKHAAKMWFHRLSHNLIYWIDAIDLVLSIYKSWWRLFKRHSLLQLCTTLAWGELLRLCHPKQPLSTGCSFVRPYSPNLAMLSQLFEWRHFIWPMRKWQQDAVFDYSSHTLWLRRTNGAKKLWFDLICIMTNWTDFSIGQLKWRHSNNWESLTRLGEHSLTWLQSVDRGSALIDNCG